MELNDITVLSPTIHLLERAMAMTSYEKSKNWNMFVEDGKLFVTKGADEIYFMDDIEQDQTNIIYESYINNSFEELGFDYEDILMKLEQAGVIYKKKFDNTDRKILKIHIKYYGTPNTGLKAELANSISKRKNIEIIDEIDNCDLMLMIRINEPLKNLLIDYDKIDAPHMLIDLGYASTISIGTLVFKNETACLGCVIGRLTKNWGDPVPPIEPDITNRHEIVTAFILGRLHEYMAYGNCPDLINGIWNFNINTFMSKYDKIYKLPWCPHCGNSKENPKITLPWLNED